MPDVTMTQVDSYLDAAEYHASQGRWKKAQAALMTAWYLLGELIKQEQNHEPKITVGFGG